MTNITTTTAPKLDARGRELLDELADLAAKLEVSYTAVTDAQKQLDDAPEKDIASFVVSLRRGGADPGAAAAKEAGDALADAERRRHALGQAVAATAADLTDHVRQHRAELLRPLRAEADKRRKLVGEAVRKLDAVIEALAEAEDEVRWVRSVADHGRAYGASEDDADTAVTIADPLTPSRRRDLRWSAVRDGLLEVSDPDRRRQRIEADERSMRPGQPQGITPHELVHGRGA